MTDRVISLDAAIDVVENIADEFEGDLPNGLINRIYVALSALPAVDDSLQKAMIEMNATKDALAEAVARIAELENEADDRNDAYRYRPRD